MTSKSPHHSGLWLRKAPANQWCFHSLQYDPQSLKKNFMREHIPSKSSSTAARGTGLKSPEAPRSASDPQTCQEVWVFLGGSKMIEVPRHFFGHFWSRCWLIWGLSLELMFAYHPCKSNIQRQVEALTTWSFCFFSFCHLHHPTSYNQMIKQNGPEWAINTTKQKSHSIWRFSHEISDFTACKLPRKHCKASVLSSSTKPPKASSKVRPPALNLTVGGCHESMAQWLKFFMRKFLRQTSRTWSRDCQVPGHGGWRCFFCWWDHNSQTITNSMLHFEVFCPFCLTVLRRCWTVGCVSRLEHLSQHVNVRGHGEVDEFAMFLEGLATTGENKSFSDLRIQFSLGALLQHERGCKEDVYINSLGIV